MEYFTLEICGLKRRLPLRSISRKTKLANFSILGDVELVDKLAGVLVKKLKMYEFDCLVGPEVKVVPLIHGIAKRLEHKRFVICRKSVKPYMVSPVIVRPQSHFPKHSTNLVLDGKDAEMVRGKRVVIIDDVVSTGITIRMIKHLLSKVDAKVVATVVVFKQGEQFDEIDNFTYIAELPVFKDKTTS